MVKVNPMTDADFDKKGGAYFDLGVHQVIITSAKNVNPASGSPYIDFQLLGENDEAGDCRLYMNEAAAAYSIPKLAGIAVHNKETDTDKQKVRDIFKGIGDTNDIDDKFLAKYTDMQAWILTEEDTAGAQKPNGGYYKRNRLYHYEPKVKAQTAESLMGGTPVDVSNEVPFGN